MWFEKLVRAPLGASSPEVTTGDSESVISEDMTIVVETVRLSLSNRWLRPFLRKVTGRNMVISIVAAVTIVNLIRCVLCTVVTRCGLFLLIWCR